jgi:glycine/D-amino acid oxidase-like deaminating enzyme
MEPKLKMPPSHALHNIADGAIDPIAVTEALVRGARGNGADIQVGESIPAGRCGITRLVRCWWPRQEAALQTLVLPYTTTEIVISLPHRQLSLTR